MNMYEKHRLYLKDAEVSYLHNLLSDNLMGIVQKPTVLNRNTHISILSKLINLKDKLGLEDLKNDAT
jgi:hypothetical protein